MASFVDRDVEDKFSNENDKIPLTDLRMHANVGVCSTSWQRKVQRFLTILSGGWVSLFWTQNRTKVATANADRFCKSSFSSLWNRINGVQIETATDTP